MKSIKMLMISTLLPISAMATPVKFNTCSQNIKINEVEGSSGYFFNEDCSKIYVLPPRAGYMSISGYRANPNLNLACDSLKKMDQDYNNLLTELELNSKRTLKMTQEILEKEENLRRGYIPVGKTPEQVEAEIDRLDEKKMRLRESDRGSEDDYYRRRQAMANTESSNVVFLIQSGYQELIKKYTKANPGISVERMPLDQSYLSIIEKSPDELMVKQGSAVLTLTLAAQKKMLPVMSTAQLILLKENPAVQSNADGGFLFGDALSGEIRFSTIGSCAIQESLGGTETFGINQLKSDVAASATYQYQVQVTRKHYITYNLKELVRQIHEQSKKSGLFSRKTVNSFIDERRSTSWIEFHVESQDARFEYTDEYVKEVKKEFIDRALAQVIAIQTGSPAAVLSLIDPSGKNGADVIGDQLGKCPHIYCQIGAAGFKVLSAIFGSEKATSNLLKTLDGQSTEIVTEKRMVPQFSTYSFE